MNRHVLASTFVTLCAAHAALAQASLVGLGDLPGAGFLSEGWAISENRAIAGGGSVVGGSGLSQILDAFVFTSDGGLVGAGLGPTGSARTFALSGDGSVAVGVSDYGFFGTMGTQAFVWTGEGGAQLIGDLPGGAAGVPRSTARGVSRDGRYVAGIGESDRGTEAWRYDRANATFEPLGDIPGGTFSSWGYGISGDGRVVVGQSLGPAGEQQAFRWTPDDGMIPLGFLPSPAGTVRASSAEAASADGEVIVGWSRSSAAGQNGQEAFRWTSATGLVGLGDLPGGAVFSAAYAVTPDGATVVGRASIQGACGPFGCGSEGRAFIWTASEGMRDLTDVLAALGVNVAGWRLQEARGISGDGRVIVGNGINPLGQVEGWIATLGPPRRPCDPDVTRDGNVDQGDVAYLVQTIAGGDNPLGVDPDFNGDGNADQADAALLVGVVAGEPCP